MSKREIIEQIKKYIHNLNKNGIPVEHAFLYGSYARDEATEDSDVDVMLVSPLFDEDIDNFAGKVWRLSKDHNILMEPYMVGSKKFKSDDYSPLLEIVRQEGIEVKV